MNTGAPSRKTSAGKRKTDKPSRDDMKRAKALSLTALVFGYNELAKLTDVLGEKVYFRLARQNALDELRASGGGDVNVTEDPVVTSIKLNEGPLYVNFYEKDIEAMRAAVAAFDAKSSGHAGRKART